MTLAGWLLFAIAAGLALAVVIYLYRRREAPGRGRAILIALRFLAFALLILLLFDPRLPAPGGPASHRRIVLLDRSVSMLLPVDPAAPRAGTRWQAAVAAARSAAGRAAVLTFGTAPRPLPPDSLAGLVPSAPESRLLPALQGASEAGAGRVLVVTDGGIEDEADVARWIPRLGIDVEVRRVASAPVPDFAVADVSAAAWAQAGKPFTIEAAVARTGSPGDSLTVEVRQAGRVLAQRRVSAPPPGRTEPAPLVITPAAPAGGGLVRYDVAVVARDPVPDDDERSIYVFVSEQPAGVAIVSFHPDWEPRFLQPVLEDALGLPTRGFLMAAPGRYIATGTGQEAGRAVGEAEVRQAIGQAEVLVLHALGTDAPAWAPASARAAARVMIFPAGNVPDLGLPFALPAAAPGEWYVSADVPASPVAPLLTGITVSDVPPLYSLRPLALPGGSWAPLLATRGRNGPASPLALAGQTGPRRWVLALGEGYWQWAFRGGNARDLYQRLWASLGGWLIQERRPLAAAAVRPVDRVVPRDEPVRWTAPGLAADSIAVRVLREEGKTVGDTVLLVTSTDTATMRPLPPGHYRYAARAFAGGKATAAAEGPFTVERFSPDFLRPLLSPARIAGEGATLNPGAVRRGRGVPLHTTPWPYIAIVLVLATEWVLRRRWGLR
jgi:hypothetical protein